MAGYVTLADASNVAIGSSNSGLKTAPQDTVGNPLNVAENGLVWLPFRTGDLNGTAINISGGTAFPENNDGSRTGIFYSAAASSTWATTGTTQFWFNGRVFGLRFSRGGYEAPIGIMIDNVAYTVPYGKQYVPQSQIAFGASAFSGGVEAILATDLSDGEHFVQIVMPSSTVVARTTGILGYICEAKVNPVPPPRGGRFSRAPQALTTSYATFGPSDVKAYAYRGIYLVNTTAAAITVNIRYNGATLDIRQIIVPANADATWDFGVPIYQNFDLKASATGVNASFMEQN